LHQLREQAPLLLGLAITKAVAQLMEIETHLGQPDKPVSEPLLNGAQIPDSGGF
jgi:hypothetical protein